MFALPYNKAGEFLFMTYDLDCSLVYIFVQRFIFKVSTV